MTCEARLGDDPEGLRCQRTDPHKSGHVFCSTSGVPDRHQNGDDE